MAQTLQSDSFGMEPFKYKGSIVDRLRAVALCPPYAPCGPPIKLGFNGLEQIDSTMSTRVVALVRKENF
jgi:hypothetical protein